MSNKYCTQNTQTPNFCSATFLSTDYTDYTDSRPAQQTVSL